MALIKWIHISDIHIKSVGEHLAKYKSDIVLRALWKDVDKRSTINDELQNLDFAFITGDIAWSGADSESSDEYVEVYKRVIEPLAHHTALPLEKIFVVPGNHDVSRGRIDDAVKKIESKLTDSDSILRLFLEPARDADRTKMFGRLNPYAAFVQERLGHLQIHPKSLVFSKRVDCPGLEIPIRIIGLNSAWFSQGGKEDRQRIVLGEPPIDELLHEPGGQGQCLTIILVHHPLKEAAAWYRDTEDKALKMIRSAANFVLAGHVHKNDVVSQFSALGACIEIVAGSIYDGDTWASCSYNYVRFDTESHRGLVYLRRYHADAVPEGEWQRDTISTGESGNGTVEVGLRLEELRGERRDETTTKEGIVDLVRVFMEEQCTELDNRPLLSQAYADRDSVSVLFPNVYVDPLVSPQRHPLGTPISLSEWLRQHINEMQKVLIIGPAGTGKTTSLISIQHLCADAFIGNTACRVPVFIEARRLKWRAAPDIEAIVNKAISRYSVGVKSLANKTVDSLRWLVLIDGIDEAFPGAYREMEKFDPRRVTLPFPHIVTCRDDFFRRNLNSAEFCSYYDEILFIEPWTIEREVPSFIESYCRERDSQIDDEKRKALFVLIKGFAGAHVTHLTPLVVTTILFLWRYDYKHMVQNRPTTFVSLLERFLEIWARREVERSCAFQSGEVLLQAYEDAAWMLSEARTSQKPLRVHEIARSLSKTSGLKEQVLLGDRGLLSVLRTETGDMAEAGAEVVSFLHEALYEYLLAHRVTKALRSGGARGPIGGRLFGHSVNQLARQILSSVQGAERSRIVVHLENEYFSLQKSARGSLGRLIRCVKAKLLGADWAAKMTDEETVRRMNVCYFWGRLEADLGGQRIKELFQKLMLGALVEYEMVINTVGSSILLLDDAALERNFVERLSDDGPLDRCNRSYHRIYYGDAGYTSPDGLLRDDFVLGRDDWVKTRQAILSRLNSQKDRDIRLRSLDLVTFRRLYETRRVPYLTPDEMAIISGSIAGVDILTTDRKAVVEEEYSRLTALFASIGLGSRC